MQTKITLSRDRFLRLARANFKIDAKLTKKNPIWLEFTIFVILNPTYFWHLLTISACYCTELADCSRSCGFRLLFEIYKPKMLDKKPE